MMKYLSRRILLLTAFYICIIFGIFALQFTNGNAFSLSIGSMMVSGTTETTDSGSTRPVLPLHIGANGLDFYLDSQNSLMAYTSDKTAVALKVTAIRQEESSFAVSFSDAVTVTFASEKRGDVDILSVRAEIPSKYQKVAFPYKTTRSARIEKKDALTLVTAGKKQYVFSGSAVSQTAEMQPSTRCPSMRSAAGRGGARRARSTRRVRRSWRSSMGVKSSASAESLAARITPESAARAATGGNLVGTIAT